MRQKFFYFWPLWLKDLSSFWERPFSVGSPTNILPIKVPTIISPSPLLPYFHKSYCLGWNRERNICRKIMKSHKHPPFSPAGPETSWLAPWLSNLLWCPVAVFCTALPEHQLWGLGSAPRPCCPSTTDPSFHLASPPSSPHTFSLSSSDSCLLEELSHSLWLSLTSSFSFSSCL